VSGSVMLRLCTLKLSEEKNGTKNASAASGSRTRTASLPGADSAPAPSCSDAINQYSTLCCRLTPPDDGGHAGSADGVALAASGAIMPTWKRAGRPYMKTRSGGRAPGGEGPEVGERAAGGGGGGEVDERGRERDEEQQDRRRAQGHRAAARRPHADTAAGGRG
jgi:hypothetical protein